MGRPGRVEQQEQGDLRGRIIAKLRSEAEGDSPRPPHRDPEWVSSYLLREVERLEAGEPYYATVFTFALYGVHLRGERFDWYELGADDQLRVAPTAHLTDGQRRCHTYVRPPLESGHGQ